ncbi:Alpha/Beta hydrolase protein [Infundibulicybe gibba]|nr:Alpha/Beta hydrolase protein [Infundibulicybe gibba]
MTGNLVLVMNHTHKILPISKRRHAEAYSRVVPHACYYRYKDEIWGARLSRTPKMILFAALLLSTAALVSLASVAPDAEAIVDAGYAKYLGNRTFPTTVAYLGIPYAEPPLGERRFRAALPLNTSRITASANGKVIDATKYPDFCIQGTTGGGDAGGAGSEDCLNVNIYAPLGAKKGSNLPVLAYIHGGGYVFGNPANWPFDHWIRQSPNVVVVSIYYRLSSFGFLAIPEFEDSRNGDFNAGFQDQILALKWIKRNIASFGGDPSQVTINGESAGGSSIELHLVAHEDEKLFSSAIAQSVYRSPVPTPEQQEPLFQFYASQAGCGSGDISSQLACLRSASVSALARAQDAAGSSAFSGKYKVFRPVVDGQLITEPPTQSILAGRFARVPLIVGATTNETLSGGTNITASLQGFFPQLSTAGLNKLLTAYPSSDFASDALRFQTITGETELRCARTIMGSAFAQHNQVWTYRYNQRNPTSGGAGVGHAAENWMMFLGTNTGFNGSTTFTAMTPVELSFAEELIAYWLSFVRSANPNTHKLSQSPSWTHYNAGPSRIVLSENPENSTVASGSVMEPEPENETARCIIVGNDFNDEQN